MTNTPRTSSNAYCHRHCTNRNRNKFDTLQSLVMDTVTDIFFNAPTHHQPLVLFSIEDVPLTLTQTDTRTPSRTPNNKFLSQSASTPSTLCFYFFMSGIQQQTPTHWSPTSESPTTSQELSITNACSTSRCNSRPQTSRPSGPASPSSPVLTLSVPCPSVKKLLHSARPSLPT